MKTGHRVYFHITILMNRSVQLVARNHECPKELNNVPCVIWSCIKMHATHEIVNYASRLIIRASRCTLRGVNNPPIMLNFGCQPYSLYREDFSVHRLSYLAPYMLRMVFIARLWLAIINKATFHEVALFMSIN